MAFEENDGVHNRTWVELKVVVLSPWAAGNAILCIQEINNM
jgi:hypothetical protein